MTIEIGKIKRWFSGLFTRITKWKSTEYTSVHKLNGRTLDPDRDSAIIEEMNRHIDHLDKRLDEMHDMLDGIPRMSSFFK